MLTALTAVDQGAAPAAPANACDAATTHAFIVRFLAAASHRDRAKLERLVAEDGRFEWFTISDSRKALQFGSYHRIRLVNWLLQSRQTFALTDFHFNGVQGEDANFDYRVRRTIGHFPRRAYEGKGAMVCASGQLGIWSMGYVGARGK